eukprot:5643273-Pyramimonas_sp.AAC.1
MHDGLHRLVVGVQGQEVGGVLGSVSAQVCSVLWSLSREGEVKVVVDEWPDGLCCVGDEGVVANVEDGGEKRVVEGDDEEKLKEGKS